MLQTKFVEKIKTHISCSITFFFLNHAVYETMWKNTVEPGKLQKTLWVMHIVCWILEATNKLSEYVMLIVFPLQQWLYKHASMLSHVYIACLVFVHHLLQVCLLNSPILNRPAVT